MPVPRNHANAVRLAAGAACLALAACGPPHPAPGRPGSTGEAAARRPAAAQLGAARAAAGQFTALYGTASWQQPPGAYLSRIAPLDTPRLQARIAADAPAASAARAAARSTLVSVATVTGIRSEAPRAATFTVAAVVTTTTPAGQVRSAVRYAVTVILTPAGTWKASQITPLPDRR